MNCQRFNDVVTDVARGQIMQATVRIEAVSHADQCVECQTRLLDEESLTRQLRGLALGMRGTTAPPELEAKLRDVFRARQKSVVLLPRTSYRRYWLTAAAAILLLVFSVIAFNWQAQKGQQLNLASTGEVPESKPVPTNSVTVDPPKVLVAKATEEAQTVKPRNRTSAFHARNRKIESPKPNDAAMVAVNNAPREITTEFMPLGYMSPASLQDGGQIVRVELPRSALANFGLPVNMDRYNEKVKADLVVGVDGLAHAIRFVQ